MLVRKVAPGVNETLAALAQVLNKCWPVRLAVPAKRHSKLKMTDPDEVRLLRN
jgi:hypothetical protein